MRKQVAVNLALPFCGAARQARNKGPAFLSETLPPRSACREAPPRLPWRPREAQTRMACNLHGGRWKTQSPRLSRAPIFPLEILTPLLSSPSSPCPKPSCHRPIAPPLAQLSFLRLGTLFYEGAFCFLGNALTPVFYGGHGAQNGLKNNRLVPLAAEPSCTSLQSLKDPTTPNLLCD